MRLVPDSIQAAPTGRAKCRGCGNAIAKGELRFGETGPNSFGEGEATSWFHLACAALMRPEKLQPVLETTTDELAERAWLAETVRFGSEHRRLPRLLRAERASSGRAHCRSCRELIAKGDWRFALQMFEEGRPNAIGTIHVSCAEAYFGTADVLGRAQRLTPVLSEPELTELAKALSEQRPGLAKTQGSDSDDDSKLGSGSA
jgi:Poly(ADP-ribose) polymerase and DNA-Ligase Zn-finger region